MLKNYYEFVAKNNFELGLKMGKAFRRESQKRLKKQRRVRAWKQKIKWAQKFLPITKKYFPHLVEEIKGYALGAKINFEELWAANMEDELYNFTKCTSIITNGGKLIGHSEDYINSAKNDICVIKKAIGNLMIFEIYYFDTLGGNAVSINSHGIIQIVNTVFPDRNQIGVPKNILARWLSETENPVKDGIKLKKIKKSSGYNHNFINLNGRIVNIEYTPTDVKITRPESPFFHTNHYLSALKKFDTYNKLSSRRRYDFAKEHTDAQTSLSKMKYILGDNSSGAINSIRNRGTVGNIIIDLEKRAAYIWLLREKNKGFVKFDLDFFR